MDLERCKKAELTEDPACCPTTGEFVRPRFFYGQRLGVVDLNDWLWYHGGKQRFHNLHGHGAGVLCGLRAIRYEIPQQDLTTVLRVRQGAALDACGREILVGVDQCIDVAAWYLLNRERPAVKEWFQSDDHRLCIGLHYLECPSDPAPAPRDPCGCDAGGCDYSRVRENFELRLFTPKEMEAISSTPVFPSTSDLEAALRAFGPNRSVRGDSYTLLVRALDKLIAAPCPVGSPEPWLWLACFQVAFEAGLVVNIPAVNNELDQRRSLMSTAALKELVLLVAAMAAGEEILGPGPALTDLGFAGAGPDSGELTLDVFLGKETPAAAPTPLNGATFKPEFVKVSLYDSILGWIPVDASAEYRTAPAPQVFIKWDNGLQEGIYRLTITSPAETPIVDEQLRPLRPLRVARTFRLAVDNGILKLAESLS